MDISPTFVSIGGNRNPAAADWDDGGLQMLAFGADNSIVLWDPQVSQPCRSGSMVLPPSRIHNSMVCEQF
jgi:hypothetical protein